MFEFVCSFRFGIVLTDGGNRWLPTQVVWIVRRFLLMLV